MRQAASLLANGQGSHLAGVAPLLEVPDNPNRKRRAWLRAANSWRSGYCHGLAYQIPPGLTA